MFNVVIEIKAPEIVEAIRSLVCALAGTKIESAPAQTQPLAPQIQQQALRQQLPDPSQYPPAMQDHIQNINSAYAQQMQQAQPQQMQPGPIQSSVPTATPTFTMDQLAVAATALSDAGKRAEVLALLAAFGVQMLTALPQEQYGNFATHLRSLGARI